MRFLKSVAPSCLGIILNRILVTKGELILMLWCSKVILRNQALRGCTSRKASRYQQIETQSDVFYKVWHYFLEKSVPQELENYWNHGSETYDKQLRLEQALTLDLRIWDFFSAILIPLRGLDKSNEMIKKKIFCSVKVTKVPRKCRESRKVSIMDTRYFRISAKVS